MAFSLSPEQRRLRASMAAHAMHAQNDSRGIAVKGQAGLLAKFLKQVDERTPGLPDNERLRRAEHLRQAHMKRFALASSRARKKVS